MNIFFDEYNNDALRRRLLYSGDVFVYSPTEASLAFCEFARQMCVEAFHPHSPQEAQHHLSVDAYVDILRSLKPNFIHHPESKRLISELLEELGCDPQLTYSDVPRLRTACAGEYLSSGLAYAFKPHRDTWYSPPMCQLNWWIPVYPIHQDNGMAFHLNYWSNPIRNTSKEFDYQEWNEVGRKQAHHQGKQDNRRQSEAIEEMQLEPDVRLIAKPGSIVVFSAAQMHSTVPNSTQVTRFSIDFRTVNADDLAANTGAPNVDSECTGTTLKDYLRIADFAHFSEQEIERERVRQHSPRFPSEY